MNHITSPFTFFLEIYATILILFHLQLFKPSTFATNAIDRNGDLELPIPNVIEGILRQFSGCELAYFQNHHNKLYFGDFHFEHLNCNSSGSYHLTINANVTFQRHNDIHKHTWTHCILAILSFQKYSQHTETWLVETLLPRYAPLLRKDEDHFIFLTHNEPLADQILLSLNFGEKIKYKISISRSDSSVRFKTVDLYGGPQGKAQLKVLDYSPGDTYYSLFPDMTNNFNGKVFRFSIPKVAFRLEIRLGPDHKYHPVRGFYKWYFDEVTKRFNFTYDMFYSSYGGGTGKQLDNGTWVGTLGDVLYGRADFASMVGEVYSRHKYIGWSPALSYEWMIFVTASPKKSYSPNALFWPFTPTMWFLFSLALILMTISLKMVGHAESSRNGGTSKWTFFTTFDYVYTTFLEQDKNSWVKTSSVRMLVSFWLLFAMITATAYRGKLVSLIAFPVNTWIPSTFEELANSDFKVALNLVGKAGAAYDWIVSSPNPVIRKLAERVEYIREGEKCLERAMKEKLGCILWKGVKDYVMVRNMTDRNGHVPLEESEGTAMFIKDGWNFEKRAVFGHIYDRSIQAAVQMGLSLKWLQMDQDFVRRERREWKRRANISDISYIDDHGAKPLIVSQFVGLFLICLISILAACLQFILELSLHPCRSGQLEGFSPFSSFVFIKKHLMESIVKS